MEDIINSFNEEWINSILNYKLLETDNYALLINSLYPKVISKLSTHEYDIAKETSFSISVFAKQFAEYCDLRNQKLDVSFDEFLKIFEHYNTGIWHHEFDYVNLYNLFKHTYDSMNFDKLDDCNIAMTRFNILKRLFISNGLEERISNEMVEPDDFINSLMKEEGNQILLSVMDELTDREKKILMQRFGLDDGRAKTLEEVGKIHNATRERIRQIEAKALRKLRHPQRSKRLKEFVD